MADKKKNNTNKGADDLTLKKRYLKSEPKAAVLPKRFKKQCYDCKTYFFGATQKEANDRELGHNCPK